jgi:hypothetical protein
MANDESGKLTPERLDALSKQYGRVESTTYNGHAIAFRVPASLDAQMWRMSEGDKERDEQLARKIVVVPEREEFAALIDAYPFMLNNKKVAGALLRAMGIYESDEGKG